MLIIELESGDRGPSAGRVPSDQCAILAPMKVLMPGLGTRVENGYALTTLGVGAMCLCPLVAVAQGTGQPEVVFDGRAIGSPGDDMLYMHGHRRVRLRCQAVAASVTGLSGNLLPHGLRNVGGFHPDYLGVSCMGTR